MNTCRRRHYTETENWALRSIERSNDYTQKMILKRNRKPYSTIALYLERTAGTKINWQRKREDCDKDKFKLF